MANLPSKDSTVSFWHREPSKFLLGHRTTAELPNDADIVIVGSGITGASAARYLAEDVRAKDLHVVMLEAREACWGATGRNGGHCQPLLFDSTPDVAAFEVRNYNTVKAYIEEHNIPCEWRSLPGCRTFWTQTLAEAAKKQVQHLKVTAPELGREVTFIDDEGSLQKYRVNGAPAATLTAAAGSLWPYKLIAFILEHLVQNHALNLQTNTPVTSIEPCTNTSTNARHTLHTPRGTLAARHVILATNAYTSHLLPEFSTLIVPERGVMTALLPPKAMPRLDTSYGFVGALGSNPTHDDYLNQRPYSPTTTNNNPSESAGGHLMFGGGHVAAQLPAVGETDDSVLDERCAAYLRTSLLELLRLGGEVEGVEELQAEFQWSGVWGTSRDGHPWVGKVPGREGVWLAGGYSGHGMPNGTLCGKAVVEMLLGEESGDAVGVVAERLIERGDLPKAYVITKERMERAERLDEVQVQGEKGAVRGRWRASGGGMRLV